MYTQPQLEMHIHQTLRYCLLFTSHSFKHFLQILMHFSLITFLLGGTEWLSNLPTVVQLVSGRETQASCFQYLCP